MIAGNNINMLIQQNHEVKLRCIFFNVYNKKVLIVKRNKQIVAIVLNLCRFNCGF